MSDSHTPWKWTRRFAVGLTISVAAFSVWGALAPHIPMPAWAAPMAAGVLMAALYGNSQGLANCMALDALDSATGNRMAVATHADLVGRNWNPFLNQRPMELATSTSQMQWIFGDRARIERH